jgi:bla regulator protein BlaR1
MALSRVLAANLFAFAGILSAQTRSAQTRSAQTRSAQTRPEGLTFEVASIRPSDPGSQGLRFDQTPDNGIRATGVTLKFLVQTAYGVEDFQISGGPGWLRSERFDVYARSENPDKTDLDERSGGAVEQLRDERFRERIRALLAARFQLTLRQELREGAVYILEQTKNGNKLSPPKGEAAGIGRNRGLINAENASVAMLAKSLSTALLRPVLDHSGLSGKYAFRLQWAEPGAPGEPEDSGVSLFTAIQEQLGLRLQPGKGPIELIFIERAEKPSPN